MLIRCLLSEPFVHFAYHSIVVVCLFPTAGARMHPLVRNVRYQPVGCHIDPNASFPTSPNFRFVLLSPPFVLPRASRRCCPCLGLMLHRGRVSSRTVHAYCGRVGACFSVFCFRRFFARVIFRAGCSLGDYRLPKRRPTHVRHASSGLSYLGVPFMKTWFQSTGIRFGLLLQSR